MIGTDSAGTVHNRQGHQIVPEPLLRNQFVCPQAEQMNAAHVPRGPSHRAVKNEWIAIDEREVEVMVGLIMEMGLGRVMAVGCQRWQIPALDTHRISAVMQHAREIELVELSFDLLSTALVTGKSLA